MRKTVLLAGALALWPAAAPAADLSVWMNMTMRTPDTAEWDRFIDDFEQRTGHTVDTQFFPHGEMQRRLFTALASGAGPDVLAVDFGWVAGFAKAGFLEDLTDDVDPEDYVRAAFESGSVVGGQYSLPLYTDNLALWVNNEMLAEAGHDAPPATWDELRTISKDMAALGEDKFGLSLGSSHWGVYQWYPFIWQNGGEIIDGEGDVRVAEPEAVEALDFLTSLHLEDGSIPANVLTARSWDEVNAPFIQERAGMLITGDWGLGPILAANPDLDFSIHPLPAADERATIIGGYHIAVNAATEHRDAAVEFVKSITGPDALELLRYTKRMSPNIAAQAPEEVAKYDARMQTFVTQAVDGRARPFEQSKWAEMDKILAGAWDRAIRGEGDPADILADAAAQIEPLTD